MFVRSPKEPGKLPRVTAIPHFVSSYEIRLSALGQPFLFQSNRESLVEAAADTFGRFRQHGSNRNPLVVQVFVDESIGDYMANGTGELAAEEAQMTDLALAKGAQRVTVSNQGHLVLLNVGMGNTAVADLQGGFAYAILTAEYARDAAAVRYNIIEALPQILLGGRGYVSVHAACVVKEDVSILLCAPSGTGKSTLTFACLRHGYQILAEDVVQVQILESGVRLWGIPWKFHLLPDTLRFFPELSATQARIQSNGEWKIEIELEELYPDSTVTDAAPGAVVFLERHAQERSTLERLGFAAAAQKFEPVWSWDLPWQPQYERQLVKLIQQNTYRLRMNDTPDEAAALLQKIISGVI